MSKDVLDKITSILEAAWSQYGESESDLKLVSIHNAIVDYENQKVLGNV